MKFTRWGVESSVGCPTLTAAKNENGQERERCEWRGRLLHGQLPATLDGAGLSRRCHLRSEPSSIPDHGIDCPGGRDCRGGETLQMTPCRDSPQCRQPSLSTAIFIPVRDMSGGSDVLHTAHGAPAPQSQASARLLKPRHGRSGWFSQTHPVSAQRAHGVICRPGRYRSRRTGPSSG
jgi:hypothetical protein